jgi:hypothetical protein
MFVSNSQRTAAPEFETISTDRLFDRFVDLA